jgi:hypothetical protein
MTNFPFHVSGSHNEKPISRPITPSILQRGTGVAADAAAVIRTSGAEKPVIAWQARCASAGPPLPATAPSAHAAAKQRRIRR